MNGVWAVHLAMKTVLLDDMQMLPITDLMDAEGDPCDDADAVACVAGPDNEGQWWTIDLDALPASALQ